MLQTSISEDSSDSSMEAALIAAPRFGLKPAAAKAIVREVHAALLLRLDLIRVSRRCGRLRSRFGRLARLERRE